MDFDMASVIMICIPSAVHFSSDLCTLTDMKFEVARHKHSYPELDVCVDAKWNL